MNHLRQGWAQRIGSSGIRHRGIALEVGIPVNSLDQQQFGYKGRISSGNEVRAFRGFGTWKELKNALDTGRWRSAGTFSTQGEGETQFALRLSDVLRGSGFHSLRGSGFLGIVEADLQGLPFETLISGTKPEDWGKVNAWDTSSSLRLREDGRSGTLYPDLGLGIGINGGVPWDRIIKIYEVSNQQVTKSWRRDEWEREIGRLQDNSDWYPPNSDDSLSQREWVIWQSGQGYYHRANAGQSEAMCGWRPSEYLRDQERNKVHKNYSSLRDIGRRDGKGKGVVGAPNKPCPKCWPQFRLAVVGSIDVGIEMALRGLPLPQCAHDGDCLNVPGLLMGPLRKAGYDPEIVRIAGWVASGLLGWMHQAVKVGEVIVDPTATQFDPTLPSLIIAPLEDYFTMMTKATQVQSVTLI